MKYFRIILGICILMGTILAVSYRVQKVPEGSHKLSVVTTLFPLYDLAKNIGKDKVDVILLLPPGTEAHNFEPKPSDIIKINQADIFIYTGEFMEPWTQDIIRGITNKEVSIVDSSTGIELMKEGEHGGIDPHFWLDFDNAKTMIHTITLALMQSDPANSQYFQENAHQYEDVFTKLDVDYTESLSKCETREIVYGGHYAFGYLARRYSLQYFAAQGFAPDSEPTANDLVKLVEQVKKDNIQYVFFEEMTSPKLAETIAKETNAKMLLLNAVHNVSKEDIEKNVSFISIMEENLKNLQIGLGCEKVETLSIMSSR